MAGDGRAVRRRHALEIVSTVLLALAAVSTAWASYQASRWHGQQALATARGAAARVDATRAAGVANRQIQIDAATFMQWIDAYSRDETELADFYFRRFRDEFRPAVSAWIATEPLENPGAPLTPFVLEEYSPAALEEADRLEASAGLSTEDAKLDLERADRYVLCVVLFALALFFAGISTRLRSTSAEVAILALGCTVFLGALAWMATFPISLQV
jgi:hypothetical protein